MLYIAQGIDQGMSGIYWKRWCIHFSHKSRPVSQTLACFLQRETNTCCKKRTRYRRESPNGTVTTAGKASTLRITWIDTLIIDIVNMLERINPRFALLITVTSWDATSLLGGERKNSGMFRYVWRVTWRIWWTTVRDWWVPVSLMVWVKMLQNSWSLIWQKMSALF